MNKQDITLKLAEIMEVLGNPLRMQIYLSVLKAGCNCDIKEQSGETGNCIKSIMKELKLPQSTVSTYVKDLERVGLVESYKKGKFLYCAPSKKALVQLKNFTDSAILQIKRKV
jgi:DNA-binding transcriptional ArsR family regulator